MQPFRFLDLPLELRELFYHQSLTGHIGATYNEFNLPQISISQVSKKVREEVRNVFQRQRVLTYRIAWYRAGNFGLSHICDNHDDHRVDWASLRHLRVEIEPTISEDPANMTKFIRRLQNLCDKLRACDKLQYLSIFFLESECLKWSESVEQTWTNVLKNGSPEQWTKTTRQPRASISEYAKAFDMNDVQSCLNILLTLRNATKASIYMPPSLPKFKSWRAGKKETEMSMMDIEPRAQYWIDNCINELEEMIKEAEKELRQERTGRETGSTRRM